jgi:hypothetical protein
MFMPMPLALHKYNDIKRLQFMSTFGRKAEKNDFAVFNIIDQLYKLGNFMGVMTIINYQDGF